jgi:hypothetical protein
MGGIARIWKRNDAELHIIMSVSVATMRNKLDRYWRIIINPLTPNDL